MTEATSVATRSFVVAVALIALLCFDLLLLLFVGPLGFLLHPPILGIQVWASGHLNRLQRAAIAVLMVPAYMFGPFLVLRLFEDFGPSEALRFYGGVDLFLNVEEWPADWWWPNLVIWIGLFSLISLAAMVGAKPPKLSSD